MVQLWMILKFCQQLVPAHMELARRLGEKRMERYNMKKFIQFQNWVRWLQRVLSDLKLSGKTLQVKMYQTQQLASSIVSVKLLNYYLEFRLTNYLHFNEREIG